MSISYNPATGEFLYSNGCRAGSLNKALGYRQIGWNGKRVYEHRLAWMFTYGDWPEHNIDHINGIRDDNRISNLRDVDYVTNNQNLSKARSKHGFRGTTWHQGKWRATIVAKGHPRHIGSFDTPEEAEKAYLEKKKELHVGFVQ